MYPVDDLDTVVKITNVPQSDIGAPLPLVLANDYGLLLAYLASVPDPNWDGSYVNVVDSESEGMVAIIRFHSPYVHLFGPPNDEAFSGHPLAKRGLRPYDAFEVQQSSWTRQLERMNSVHSCHDRDRFMEGKRHYVFAFHDSTFECVAEGFDARLLRGSMSSALATMAELL